MAPDEVSTAEAGSEEGAQVVAASEATPVIVGVVSSEVTEDLAAATVSEKALVVSVDEAVADSIDGAVDVETTEQEKTADEEVDMAGEAAVVATAAAVLVSGAIDPATEQCAAIDAPEPAMGCEDSTPSVSVGVATADNEVSATLDDVQIEVEPVVPEEPGLDRGASASDCLVGEEGPAVSIAATDSETRAGDALLVSAELADVDVEQATEGHAGDDMASAEVDTGVHAGDDTAGSSEGAGSAAPVATELLSLVVDEVPEVGAPVSLVEDASADVMVSFVRPRDHSNMRNYSMRSGPLLLSRPL